MVIATEDLITCRAGGPPDKAYSNGASVIAEAPFSFLH
jgi:hypothetical protein